MTDQPPPTVVPLFGPGIDPRLGEPHEALLETVRERGRGLPFLSVLGAPRFAEDTLIRDRREAV